MDKSIKSGDKEARAAFVTLEKTAKLLEAGHLVRKEIWTKEEAAVLRELQLLTQKPVLYAANVSEKDLPEGGAQVEPVRALAAKEASETVIISGKVEAELVELSPEEAALYLKELGLKEPGLHQLIRASYKILGLVTFLTAGEPEVRAWTVPLGTKAPQAAGVIHSDFERGFIRAEVMSYDDLARLGSQQAVKEKGLYRVEGKDYVIQDGDVVYFRFNV